MSRAGLPNHRGWPEVTGHRLQENSDLVAVVLSTGRLTSVVGLHQLAFSNLGSPRHPGARPSLPGSGLLGRGPTHLTPTVTWEEVPPPA